MDDKLNSFFSEINKYIPEKDKKTHLDIIISEIKEGLINTNNFSLYTLFEKKSTLSNLGIHPR